MFSLSQVVPFGRCYEEYCRMFALSDDDLRLRILGCADGPASFNAEATRRGYSVVSCDPLYRCDHEQIRRQIEITLPEVIQQAREHAEEFIWNDIPSPAALGQHRWNTMQMFLTDYEQTNRQQRYVDGELPALPFANHTFDLALCSHFLFLYTDHLSESFHLESLLELCRVASEVRVFPLLALDGTRSRYLTSIMDQLSEAGFEATIVSVPYEFRRGANQMLRILARE